MIKVEDFQHYGKEQYETVLANAGNFQKGVQSIASALGDYAKKSFEDGNAFVAKLSSVKSLDNAIEVQADYAKSSYATFVAESQKIGELYADLAKQAFKPFDGFAAKFVPTAR